MLPSKIQQELALEAEAKRLILDANILENLKELGVYIWAINACLAFEDTPAKLILSVDTSTHPKIDLTPVVKLLNYVLTPLHMPVVLQPINIKNNCCYGNCKGCLNGDAESQPIWIGREF